MFGPGETCLCVAYVFAAYNAHNPNGCQTPGLDQTNLSWDSKDPYHFSKTKKYDAWCEIAKELNTNHDEVKKKMSSLLGSFRREKSK